MPNPTYTFTFADALFKQDWGVANRQHSQPLQQSLELEAARGEITGFQTCITCPEAFVLTVDTANWLHPLGFSPRVRLEVRIPDLPSGAVEVFPIGWIEGDDRRLWMETLERSGTIEVPAGRPQSIYIRLSVPTETAPRAYHGTVRAYGQFGFDDETLLWQGEATLSVVDLALPPVREYAFHLNLWQHLTSLSRFYRVPLWSEQHFAIIDNYYASIARLGQKALTLVVTEIPWSGQRCYRDTGYPSYLFEHAVVGVTRARDGSLRLETATLDRLLELGAKHGIDREIDLIGLVNIWVDEEAGFGKVAPDAPDALRVRCYDEESGAFAYLRSAEDLRQFIRLLHDHFIARGVIERVRVTADEPGDLEAFRRSLAFVQEAGPEFRYAAAINHFEFLEDAAPEVLDFVPVLPLACKDAALTQRLADSLRERGGRMLWYICCWPPIPNTFLHSPLVESRLLGWLNYALGLDGFLRWAFCLWTADPWRRVSWRAPNWPAGDMYFVLPGFDGAPVETLRYEALRMAVQDYELLRAAAEKLGPERFADVWQRTFAELFQPDALTALADPRNARAEDIYTLDPADIHAARRRFFESLA